MSVQSSADDMLDWLSAPSLSVSDGGSYDVEIHRHHFGQTIVRVIPAHSEWGAEAEPLTCIGFTLTEALTRAVAEVRAIEESRPTGQD